MSIAGSQRAAETTAKAEVRAILRLGAPMMVAQGGLVAMGVVDTFLIGRVSALEMGAVGLGNAVVSLILVLGIGLAMGIEPLASQAFGANKPARAHHWLWQGTWISVAAGVPLGLVIVGIGFLLEPFGIEPAIAERTRLYLFARLPGLVANTAYAAHRSYLTSIHVTRPVLIAVIGANVLNVILDWVLLFELGLGAFGIGLATSACWLAMLAVVFRAVGSAKPEGAPAFVRPEAAGMRRVVALGLPIGLQLAVEVGVFALVSLLIGRMGAAPLAGHQIALTLASFSFMAAVGISVAATARVGFHIGSGRSDLARRTGVLSVVIGSGFMGICGLAFIFLGTPIARLFAPSDPEVVVVGARLLFIAGIFAVADGVQAVASGALRGAGDTKWPFLANLAAHWGIGFPLALYLGYVREGGPEGLWWGLTGGLVAVALGLFFRFVWLTGRAVARVED